MNVSELIRKLEELEPDSRVSVAIGDARSSVQREILSVVEGEDGNVTLSVRPTRRGR